MGFYASSITTRVVNITSGFSTNANIHPRQNTKFIVRIVYLLDGGGLEGVNRREIISFAYSIARADSFDSLSLLMLEE